MTDNVDVTPGSGATISTEEISTLNGLPVSPQHGQRMLLAMRTADGVAVDIAPATPTNLPNASGALTTDTTLFGFTARETTGSAAAFFRLRAGSVTGAILATVTLSANESVRDWYGPSGIAAAGGVYFELVSGAVAGGVQTR